MDMLQGKHFSITDPKGVSTVIYQIYKTKKEFLKDYKNNQQLLVDMTAGEIKKEIDEKSINNDRTNCAVTFTEYYSSVGTSFIEKLILPILSFPRQTTVTLSPSVSTSSTWLILSLAILEI